MTNSPHFSKEFFISVASVWQTLKWLEQNKIVKLKTIDTIVKTHDKDSIFSWNAFEMCSIDPTIFHSMLTGLSDRYWWRNFEYFDMGVYGKLRFFGHNFAKTHDRIVKLWQRLSTLVFHTNKFQNKTSLTHLIE